MARKKENAVILSQEMIARDIYSMWIKTDAAKEAAPGQFISMYTNDGSRLLPRPISICEINNGQQPQSCVPGDREEYRDRAVFQDESRGHDPGDRTPWKWIPV